MEIGELRAVLHSCEQTPVDARSRLEAWMLSEPQALIRMVPKVLGAAEDQPQVIFFAKILADGDFDVASISDPDVMPLDEAINIAAALLDSHHRVATTALVGLWLLGKHEESGERLFTLAGSNAAPARAAVARAMGELADRRFFDSLVKLTKDESALMRPARSTPCACLSATAARFCSLPNEKREPPCGDSRLLLLQLSVDALQAHLTTTRPHAPVCTGT